MTGGGPPGRGRWRVWVGIAVFTLGLQGVVPLFPLYEERFGLSTGDLMLVWAAYPLTLVPALVIQGPLSDHLGRKVVVVPAMVLFAGASLVLAAARGLPWLLAGRVIQGWAAGAFWGSSAAYVRDLTPDERRDDASLLISATFMGGAASGVFAFGTIGDATNSIVVPWVIHAAILAAAAVFVARVAETVPRRGWPGVDVRMTLPDLHRRTFTRFVVPATLAAMSMGAITTALAPAMISEVRGVPAAGLAGVLTALFLGTGSAVQLLSRTTPPLQVARLGSVLLPLGMLGLAAGVEQQALAVLAVALVVAGIGTGLALRGLYALAERMTEAAERAAVLSTFTVLLYLASSLPAMAAGYVSEGIGLASMLVVFTAVGAGTLAVAYAVGARRLRVGAAAT